MAQVDGSTDVQLNTGTVEADVFGGGKGKLNDDHTVNMSADVTGTTHVTANGTTFKFPENGIDANVNHNIYGGGNLACKIGTLDGEGKLVDETGNTTVTINAGMLAEGFLDGEAASAWGKWKTAVAAQDDNVVQGSVFGGGYGVHTSVLGTATVKVNVADDKANKAMVDVVGGGYNGYVLNKTAVTVEGAAEIYKMYGGGLGSRGGYADSPTSARSHANLSTYTMQQTIGSVGENKSDDGTSVTIKGGKFYSDIFGGGAGLKYNAGTSYLNVAEVFGKANVVVDAIDGWTDESHAFAHKIYGGGALGMVYKPITVEVKSGTMAGAEIFAGSLGEKGHLDKAKVTASATIRTVANSTEGKLQGYFNIYGGCDMAQMEGNTNVELQHGTFSGSIFGAGKGLPSEETSPGEWEEYLEYGKVKGNTTIVIDEPKLLLGKAEGLDDKGVIVNETNAIKIYGGGALGLVDGIINPVTLKSGTIYGGVFGGSLGEKGHLAKAKVTGNTGVLTEPSSVNVTDGKAAALLGRFNIYGGCDMAQVDGNTSVKVTHGSFSGTIYGGGNGIPEEAGTKVGEEEYMDYGMVNHKTNVLVDGQSLDLTMNVYGGGALGKVGEDTKVTLNSGKINGNIYGGSYGESARPQKGTAGSTLVEILGGSTTGEVYGGGALANITDNTEVHLYGGTVGGNVFGGGLGDATTYQEVGGDTKVILGVEDYSTASVIESSIFGANNINGTPRGRAFVHVRRTVPRSTNKSGLRNVADNAATYDVAAVYGGGNLSAHQPSDAAYAANKGVAEVLVENCDNSIAYVYGGGNAAPVPATKVTIYGADAIDHAFAGGNGAGADNPGADVGYLNYFSTPEPAAVPYGTGKSSITVYGGIIHNVYGGSNTLGYIRGGTSVSVANEEGACPLNVGSVFGGGNQADINCDVTMNLDCSQGGAILYAGANNADVDGNITLNIYSGTFGKVFCGNNESGAVKGKLTLNVDETGCWPVMIGELYGGGNLAGYSVYGYEVDADGKTKRDADGHVVLKTSGTQLYGDPEINLISFTRIGKVFGGGLGEHAVVYGNTHVNVNPIKGIFAGYDDTTEGRQVAPSYILNGNDERVKNEGTDTLPYGISWGTNGNIVIPNEAGSIGDIFGGGNAGAVYGNTNVKIGTGTKFKTDNKVANKHLNATEDTVAEEVAVTITGSVFGGGEKAIVSGNTDVKIGEE